MRQFLVGLLLVVVSAAQAQFRNQQLLPFPYATSVASNDVFVVGQVGVTNKNLRAGQLGTFLGLPLLGGTNTFTGPNTFSGTNTFSGPNPFLGVINVKTYGAKGDGTTDDTAALHAALDSSNQFRIVFFPKGTYPVTTNLNWGYNMYLLGEGPDSTIILPKAPFLGTAIFDSGSWHCYDQYWHYSSIENMSIRGHTNAPNTGPVTGGGEPLVDYGIRVFAAGELCHVRNVSLQNFNKCAVWTTGNSATFTLENASIHNCREYSVAITGAATYVAGGSQDTNAAASMTNGSGQVILRHLTSDHAGLGVVGMNCNGYVTLTDVKFEMNTNATYYTNWASSSNIIVWTTNQVAGGAGTAPSVCNPSFYMHGGTIQHEWNTNTATRSQNIFYIDGHNPGSAGVRFNYEGIRYTPTEIATSFLRISNAASGVVNFPMISGDDVGEFRFGFDHYNDTTAHFNYSYSTNATWAMWTNTYGGAVVRIGNAFTGAGPVGYGGIGFVGSTTKDAFTPYTAALWGNTNQTVINIPNSSSGVLYLRSFGTDFAKINPNSGITWTNELAANKGGWGLTVASGLGHTNTSGVRQFGVGGTGNAEFAGSVNATNGFWVGSAEGIPTTITNYAHDAAGTGSVTNVITVVKGIITGWTQ